MNEKQLKAKEKIIVALDVPTLEQAKQLVYQLNSFIGGFKVGLELLTNVGAPTVIRSLDDIYGRTYVGGKWYGPSSKIFFDGKFKDIPRTVEGAAKAVTRLGVRMFNVHCLGGKKMMEAAKKAAEEEAAFRKIPRPLVLGVTLLTSLDYQALEELRIVEHIGYAVPREKEEIEKQTLQRLIVYLALSAQEAELDGVIASPQEVELLRQWCQPGFLIVTPGVRPIGTRAEDQKRTGTPAATIKSGADYVVIGKPITDPPPEIGSPVDAVKKIIEEIIEVI